MPHVFARPAISRETSRAAPALTIGGVARAADVGVETVRYYQRRRLLPIPHGGGVRRYSADVVDRIRFIKRSQALGFTLDEIRELMGLEDGGNRGEIRTIANSRLAGIRDKLKDLQRMERLLSQLVLDCELSTASTRCPIIAALSGPS
jgi:Hg(II)-responsive transcriptional regulator